MTTKRCTTSMGNDTHDSDRRRFVTSAAAAGIGLALGARARVAMGAPAGKAAASEVLVPELDGEPWQVAGQPDLGPLGGDKQQPVDFGMWQAADGTWQLWSCIRGTKETGHTRLLYRWQGKSLTDKDWQPMGIAMRADPSFGESDGGLQAPFVLKVGRTYNMLYGDWANICVATGVDGKTFARQLSKDGKAALFASAREPDPHTRDPMVLAHAGRYYGYTTCYSNRNPGKRGAVYCHISKDLRSWAPPKTVAVGGAAGDGPYSAECPFVHFHQATKRFYLFRTQKYGAGAQTHVYASPNPLDFGIDDDRYLVTTLPLAAPEVIEHAGGLYLAHLNPGLDGIRIARLKLSPGRA